MENYKRLGIDTLIMASYPDDATFNELSQWVTKGNHLIVMDLPRNRYPVFKVVNHSLSNMKDAQPNLMVADNNIISVKTQGSVVFKKEIEGNYILHGEVKAQKPLDADNHIGVIFNYQDSDNYHYFFLRENLAVLYEETEGKGKEVWHAGFSRGEGTHIIEIVVSSSVFRFNVDGKDLGEYTASMPFIGGFLGYKWYNLDGQLGELATSSVYENRVADGIIGNGIEWKMNEVTVPYIEPSNLPMGSIITAYYTKNNEKTSIFSFSTPNEKGQITYLSFSSLLKPSNISVNLGRIFEVANIDLPKRQSQQALPLTEPINYVRGSVTLSGIVSIESPSIIVLSENFHIEIDGKKVESKMAHSILDYPIERISSTSAIILSNENGVYPFIDIATPSTLYIKKGYTALLGGVNSVNSTIELISDTGVVRVSAQTPKFCIEGNATFQEAYISSSSGKSIVYGRAASLSGLTEFAVENIDRGVIRISDFAMKGSIQIQQAETRWEEWNIKWDRILSDSPHWLALATIVSIIVAKWARKLQQNSFAGK